MASIQKFERARKRGIVWVCDIEDSSKYLNRNDTAAPIEEFLNRFLYMSLIAVEASGGEFIKWTGDGFLAWYEAPLDREVGSIVSAIFDAAWHLSFFVNITRLGVISPVKFHIRHAVTYEKDALVIDLEHSKKITSRDVLGRSVVLAFRLSSLKGVFPSIVTQKELVDVRTTGGCTIDFKKLTFTRDEKLKYFKGQEWGTRDLYISADKKPKHRSHTTVVKMAVKAIDEFENPEPDYTSVKAKMATDMLAGPEWSRQVLLDTHKFMATEMAPALKGLIDAMKKFPAKLPASTKPTTVQ